MKKLVFMFVAVAAILFMSAINLRHKSTSSPHFVAKTSPCRNNFNNNQVDFLESARNPHIFASVKVHLLVIV